MKKRILVIDGERLMLYGLQKALRHDLVEVDTAASAGEAMQAIRSCTYDLCLIDVRLPDENGFRLMKRIRDLCPDMKIIMMTASDIGLDDKSNEDMQEAKAKETCHFLCKPFDIDELKHIIARVIWQDGPVAGDGWFEAGRAVISRRRVERKTWSRKIDFSVSVISEGEVMRKVFAAESIDLGDDGIGLLSLYPLKKGEIVSFADDLEHKSGIVVWSSMLDEHQCRAGIRFA